MRDIKTFIYLLSPVGVEWGKGSKVLCQHGKRRVNMELSELEHEVERRKKKSMEGYKVYLHIYDMVIIVNQVSIVH